MKEMIKETPKTKKAFFTKKKATIAMLFFTLGNLFALSSATIAWFALSSGSAGTIQTFSGDLDVSIEKVTAYKYVYPYHRNSNEFVDYEGSGAVKSYVVEDASIEIDEGTLSNTVTIALGVNTNQAYATSASDASISATKVHYENSQDFKYYILGDEVFTGVSNNPWSTLTSTTFSSREAPTVDKPVTVSNIVVSAGSEFVLFDASSIDGNTCSYFTYTSLTAESNKVARFDLVDNNKITCLKSGIYSFTYRVDNSSNKFLDIELVSRTDNAIIGTNLIDPTKITIDYRGSADKTLYPDINDYLPIAIQEQNTMVVIDVMLKYQNKNAIDAGLKVIREAQNAQSIYGFSGKYATTASYTYSGYIDDSHRNPLNASDFYAFYFLFAKETNAYADGETAWNALHALKTDYEVNSEPVFAKFQNDTSYDTSFECTLNPKTNSDSTLIPGSATDNIYHCYIAIDYDYEYMRFFVEQNRVGKTYLLDRDFGFYYSATQHVEEGGN